MPYAEALEQQVRLLRLLRSTEGVKVVAASVGPHAANMRVSSGTPPSESAAVRLLCDTLINALSQAEPYFWANDKAEVVLAASREMPPWTLSEAVCPSFAGWFWFEKPVPLPATWDGAGSSLRAISWVAITDVEINQVALQFAYWMHLPGIVALPCAPTVTWGWRINEATDDLIERAISDERNRARVVAMVRLTAACFAFLDQRIMVAPKERADRGARRRLEHDGWTSGSLVRVVQLRRRQSHATDDREAVHVEWSCQWVVRGHWRNQACGEGQKERRPIWITPYVKGPEDKPLRPPRATVFAVVK